MSSREWLLLVALSALWGATFFFAEVALAEIAPLALVAARVGLAALALGLVAAARRQRLPRGRARDLLVMALLNNVLPFSLIFWGQTRIDSGLAAVLNATTPLFTALLAHGLTPDERLTPRRLGGVLLGLAGVAVMIGPRAVAGAGQDLPAQAACLAAACAYALAGLFGRRFRGDPPTVTAAGQLAMSALVMTPVALAVHGAPAVPGARALMALAGLALLSTALAYAIYFRLLATAGATNLLLVTLLIPVTALLLGTLVLGERLEAREIAGMAGIGLGLGLLAMGATGGRVSRDVRSRAGRRPTTQESLLRGRQV